MAIGNALIQVMRGDATSWDRCRANMEKLARFEGLSPESQGQHLGLTVLHVPCSLESGVGVYPVRRGRECEEHFA